MNQIAIKSLAMKSWIVFVFFVFCLGACVSVHNRTDEQDQARSMAQRLGSLRSEGPRKRILLLPFINDSVEKDPAVPKTGRDALVAGLRMTDNFIILDNSDIPKDLSQYKKDNSYDLEELGKVASELGVMAIIEGRVIEIKAHRSGDEVGLLRSVKADVFATVGVRVFSALNHKEVLNEVRSAQSTEKNYHVAETGPAHSLAADPTLIREALVSAFHGTILPITKSVDKLTWSGKIALVTGDRIYLNAGRLTGINIGDILRVTEEGTEIFDPDSGVLIGRAPGRLKGTLEVVSYFGKDGCISIVHSGTGFKENDRVELY